MQVEDKGNGFDARAVLEADASSGIAGMRERAREKERRISRTTIVLADDHHIVRQGLRALLEAEPDFSVVGEAADGLTAIDLVERLKPRVLVIDVVMPGLNGLEVTRRVSRSSPRTRVVILSM